MPSVVLHSALSSLCIFIFCDKLCFIKKETLVSSSANTDNLGKIASKDSPEQLYGDSLVR